MIGVEANCEPADVSLLRMTEAGVYKKPRALPNRTIDILKGSLGPDGSL